MYDIVQIRAEADEVFYAERQTDRRTNRQEEGNICFS